jgi:hypothetical protein
VRRARRRWRSQERGARSRASSKCLSFLHPDLLSHDPFALAQCCIMSGQTRQLHQDAQALRDWVTWGDKTRYDLLPQGVVMVGVTHSNLNASYPDIRLDLHTTVSAGLGRGPGIGVF